MDSNKFDCVENEFEKEMADLKEWQENQFNPGYYIGTGRVPRPLSSLSNHPVILIVFGLIFAIPLLVFVLFGKGSENIPNIFIALIVPAILIYGGNVRLVERKRNKKII